MSASSEQAAPIRTTVDAPETWQRVVHVTIDADHFETAYAKNLRSARKSYARPGFRKGKVSMAIVEQELGGEVRMNTLEELIPKAYQGAMIEHKFWPVGDPVLGNLKMEPGEAVSLDLTVEVRPEVEPVDYNDLVLAAREPSVADGAVDGTLERIRESRAVWDTVEKTAEDGDKVKVDITPRNDDGTSREEDAVKDYEFEVGNENNFEVFNEALSGAAAGDVREASVTYPDDYTTEALRGQAMVYDLKVNAVQQKELPEVDDDFANALKEGQTLLELRKAVHDELLAEDTRRTDRLTREEIVDKLLEANPLEVPPSMVADYVKSSLEEMKQRSAMYGQPADDAAIEGYREMAEQEARRTLKAMFVLEGIRAKESISVSEEDVRERIDEIAKENGYPADQYREYVTKNKETDRIAHELAETRTFEFLISRAKFEERPAAEDQAESAD